MTRAAGPLGKVIADLPRDRPRLRLRDGGAVPAHANALVIMNRLAFPEFLPADGGRPGAGETVGLADGGTRALLSWAISRNLGQVDKVVRRVHHRRDRAIAALRAAGQAVARLHLTPQQRMCVGTGNRANAHEIGFSLHGTYGWPVIAGSALKGVAAAYAAYAGYDEDAVAEVFGGPRPGRRATADNSAMAPVTFLDAIPAGSPVTVAGDVLTPHVKPYYDSIERGDRTPAPPAEHHNPVPVQFLTVTGTYAVDIVGRDATAVQNAADWLAAAGQELGVGAKTSSGYGYATVVQIERPDGQGRFGDHADPTPQGEPP